MVSNSQPLTGAEHALSSLTLPQTHVVYRARNGEVAYQFDTAPEAEAFRAEHRGSFIVRSKPQVVYLRPRERAGASGRVSFEFQSEHSARWFKEALEADGEIPIDAPRTVVTRQTQPLPPPMPRFMNTGIFVEPLSSTEPAFPSLHPTFTIDGVARAGGATTITLPIGVVSAAGVDAIADDKLGEFFRIVNACTLNMPYAIDSQRFAYFGRERVPRPNHNGTHSARQVRLIEALFGLIEKNGTPKAKSQLAAYTVEERQNIKLAAYFLRAGRVDETGHGCGCPDNYYERSAQIYEAYAKQLALSPESIAWTRHLLARSGSAHEGPTGDYKHDFALALLVSVHELDLVRCFGRDKILRTAATTQSRLKTLVDVDDVQGVSDILFEFARRLCRVNGARLRDLGLGYTDGARFVRHSQDGAECWSALLNEALPEWP